MLPLCNSKIAKLIRFAFKQYDSGNNITSKTFGSDFRVSNFIYGVTKMQYKQGKVDPSEFKQFLNNEDVKPGLIV